MKSCKEVAKMMASGEELSFFQKLSTKMHFGICRVCRVYKEQQELITKTAKERHNEKKKNIEEVSETIKKNVLNNIKRS